MSLTNELAKERTWLAADRTLMAWMRTSLALIGFGFAIAQTYEYVAYDYLERTGTEIDPMRTPLIFGSSFLVLGLLAILAGVVQYVKVVNRIKDDDFKYSSLKPAPMIFAFLLLVIGIFGLIAILI